MNPTSSLGFGSVLLRSSEGGARDSTADTLPSAYLGPGTSVFPSAVARSGPETKSVGTSLASDSCDGDVGGLMLQHVVCTSTVGETQSLHSIQGRDSSNVDIGHNLC